MVYTEFYHGLVGGYSYIKYPPNTLFNLKSWTNRPVCFIFIPLFSLLWILFYWFHVNSVDFFHNI